MTGKTTDFDVERAPDGCMLADSYQGYACNTCDAFHIMLKDKRDRRFAVMMVYPDDLVPLARTLLTWAVELEQAGKLEMPKTN